MCVECSITTILKVCVLTEFTRTAMRLLREACLASILVTAHNRLFSLLQDMLAHVYISLSDDFAVVLDY